MPDAITAPCARIGGEELPFFVTILSVYTGAPANIDAGIPLFTQRWTDSVRFGAQPVGSGCGWFGSYE
ncbi:MAG: hypothetical protein AAF749_09195 [Pseudomonadota bacterium]